MVVSFYKELITDSQPKRMGPDLLVTVTVTATVNLTVNLNLNLTVTVTVSTHMGGDVVDHLEASLPPGNQWWRPGGR